MKPNGFVRLTAILVVCIFINLACTSASHAQLIGCEPTGTGSCIANSPGPAPGEEFTELSSGIFTYSKTDMTLPGPMPINVTRIYRSADKVGTNWNARTFGLGTSLSYDIFLYSYSEAANGEFTDAEVVMPDGGMIKCIRSDSYPATDYVDAVFACNQQPTGVWFGSTITYNSGNSGWDLKRPDGTAYHFGYNSPLQTITDRFENELSITRGGTKASICSNAIPANSISTISSSNGRSVSFCYDDSNDPTGISKVTDNSSVGKLVTYTYGSNEILQTVTQTAYNAKATTTYKYNQTSPSGQGNITEIITNDACSGSNCGSPLQFFTYITYVTNALGNAAISSVSSQLPGNGYSYSYTIPSGWTSAQKVKVTLPDNSKRTFVYDQAGYVIDDQRNVGVSGTFAEYTAFTRNQQTVGTVGNATGTTEFVGEVQEQDQNGNTVRQTKYNYDNNGNILSTTIWPQPGAPDNVNTDCCTTSATWNYTYTTYNRLTSAVEPLAFNGVGSTYSYADTPSAPQMYIYDPLGRETVVKYNPQGQPISTTDPLGNVSSASYYPSGDLQSETDAVGNTATYQTDPDGRVKSITSPANEVTTYNYDALDDVTDVYVDPGASPHFNLHTNYTYDLIGEILTETTPLGYTTTYARNAALTKTTVTDPRGKTTVTNIDGQGGATNYTDKRGLETAYNYDQFGRISEVFFNSAGKSGYPNFDVLVGISGTNGAYDALDRPENIYYLASGNLNYYGLTFTYDSLDDVRSEGGEDPSGTVSTQLGYQYDLNGRRIQFTPTLNGNAQPTINYGYDCADELISMSNKGSALQSCSPSNNVTNGDPSTQVAIYYDTDGIPWFTVVDDVLTLFTRDSDENVLEQEFSSYSSGFGYGNLNYIRDADERVVDESNYILPTPVTLPPGDSATYSTTDQLATWNGAATNPDAASNIINDPVLLLTYTWNARNELSSISGGVTEEYDVLGRRVKSTSGTSNLSLIHDGSSVIGSLDSVSGNTWSLLPGGLAGSLTSNGTTTTWVPLLDADGSTIALVNAANTGASPTTFFSYDPSGVSTISGLSNSFPFLYQGLEHEITDPGQLYFEPSGNVYNPQIQRELSQLGQQGIGGAPSDGGGPGNGGFENFGSGHGHGGPGSNTKQTISDLLTVGSALPFFQPGGPETPISLNPLSLAQDIEDIINFFDHGSSDQAKPPQLDHGIHPMYPYQGIAPGLTPSQKNAKCPCPTVPAFPQEESVDANIRATQKGSYSDWYNRVLPGGVWAYNDYKGGWHKWDDAGNFNFGATGRAAGNSDRTLVSAGGALQGLKALCRGKLPAGSGFPFIKEPFGDSKAAMIRNGEKYYDCGCYKH